MDAEILVRCMGLSDDDVLRLVLPGLLPTRPDPAEDPVDQTAEPAESPVIPYGRSSRSAPQPALDNLED